jgi:hypothetical protein
VTFIAVYVAEYRFIWMGLPGSFMRQPMSRKGQCKPAWVLLAKPLTVADVAGHSPISSSPDAAPRSARGPPFDAFDGYRFNDLKKRRIVSDRADLSRKIKAQGFPPPIKLGDARQAAAWWPKVEVHAWIERRAAKRNWPPNRGA